MAHRNRRNWLPFKPPLTPQIFGKEEIRESLKTRDWQAANRIVREWEANGRVPIEPPTEEQSPVTIRQVEEEFVANAVSKKLKPASIQRYQIIFCQLDAFAAADGLQFFNQQDTRTLNKFRGTWKGNSGLADLKKLERLRAFCKFAVVNGYAAKNPAEALENPKIRQNPTLPFSSEEMLRILATAAQYIAEREGQAKTGALRVRALALLLRYAGLADLGCPGVRS